MSSSAVPIPTRRNATTPAAAESSYSSSSSSSYGSPLSSTSSSLPSSTTPKPSSKGKAPVAPSSVERIAPRRPSLLGSSLSKSEHTVIDLAHSDGPPRLVTCVKSSQGFDWNQELFLPSYADRDSHDLEHKQEPVQEIILTDEEAAAMLPQ